MMKLNIQFFGGRGSAGGNAKGQAEANANASGTTVLPSKRPTLSAEERNQRELMRAERESASKGVVSADSLKKGETYSIQWGNEVKQGTYIGGKVVNGDAVRDFRGTDGKIMRIDNEYIQQLVKKRG